MFYMHKFMIHVFSILYTCTAYVRLICSVCPAAVFPLLCSCPAQRRACPQTRVAVEVGPGAVVLARHKAPSSDSAVLWAAVCFCAARVATPYCCQTLLCLQIALPHLHFQGLSPCCRFPQHQAVAGIQVGSPPLRALTWRLWRCLVW